MTFYIAIGVSGSGKTTYTNKLNPTIVINRDVIFNSFHSKQELGVNKARTATRKVTIEMIKSVKSDDICYYDSTNLTPEVRLFFMNLALECNLKVIYLIFHQSVEILKDRIIQRKNHPTQKFNNDDKNIKIMNDMIKYYIPPNTEELSKVSEIIYIAEEF